MPRDVACRARRSTTTAVTSNVNGGDAAPAIMIARQQQAQVRQLCSDETISFHALWTPPAGREKPAFALLDFHALRQGTPISCVSNIPAGLDIRDRFLQAHVSTDNDRQELRHPALISRSSNT